MFSSSVVACCLLSLIFEVFRSRLSFIVQISSSAEAQSLMNMIS